jgi:hypothetical protein
MRPAGENGYSGEAGPSTGIMGAGFGACAEPWPYGLGFTTTSSRRVCSFGSFTGFGLSFFRRGRLGRLLPSGSGRPQVPTGGGPILFKNGWGFHMTINGRTLQA